MTEQTAVSEAEAVLDAALAGVRKHPMARCEDCPLREEGAFVPADGPAKADIAVVGEAPGKNEAKVGRPFIGESGQLLNKILTHYGKQRRDILLTNAALCRRPDGATPSSAALEACRPRLVAELKERGVKQVIAFGNSSAQSILQTRTGITKLRVGPGRTTSEFPDMEIICTFHPAAALRQAGYFPSIVNDFGKLNGLYSTWYEPKWRAYEYPEEALVALAELQKIDGPVTIDIESAIEKDVSFETPSRHVLLCIGLGFQRGRVAVIGETALRFPEVREALCKYLLTHPVTGQNGKFDLKGLYVKLREFIPEGQALKLAADTMLRSYCLDERPGVHSLETLGVEKLGTPFWKSMVDRYVGPHDSYSVVPRPVLYKYNAFDIHATDMVNEVLTREMGPDQKRLHEFLVRASNELMYPELNGIGVDLKYNSELAIQYTASLDLLETRIATTIPDHDKIAAQHGWRYNQFNPRSPKQVKEVIKEVFGLRLPMKLNTKKEYVETTDAETLASLLERNLGKESEEFFRRMLEHRKEAKMFGTYIRGLRKRVYRGRVYPTFLLHGTTTGRLSCRNPNLQNIPRDSTVRKQFVPTKPGNVFVEGDFGQNELRVLCWLAQDEYLRGIFNDPTRDLFDELTPRLYGDISGLSPPQRKELRIRVKAYVYGVSYGRTAFSIALEYGIPLAEAQRGMDEFFKVIPATVKFRERTRDAVLNGNDLVTPYGRHRRFWLITDSNKKDVMNEALAFKPQSIGSDICLDAFTHLRPALKGIGWIRNIVHDSQLVECHERDVDEVKETMQSHMLEAARRVVGDFVKFKVDFGIGHSWGELEKVA